MKDPEVRTPILSEQSTQDAKARLQAEADRRWPEIRRSFLRANIPGLLDWLSYSATAGVALALLSQLLIPTATAQPTNNVLKTALANNPVFAMTATALVFLLAAALFAARRRLTRLLNEL